MNLTELAVKTVYWFFLYGFIGWGVEVVYAAVKTHKLVNRGFLCGPICPIYGFGMVGLIYSVSLIPMPDSGSMSAVAIFFIGMILTTAIELVGGWALFKIYHIRWWDYSNMKFNLGGYICPQFSLLWGLGSVLMIKVVHPLLARGSSPMPFNIMLIVDVVLLVLFVVDVAASTAAAIGLNKYLREIDELRAKLRVTSDKLTTVLGNVVVMIVFIRLLPIAMKFIGKNSKFLTSMMRIPFKYLYYSLPVGCVLTMVGTGSEMNAGSVITNHEQKLKIGHVFGEEVMPKFSILNPVFTFTLPKYQMIAGFFDIMSHILEQYFSGTDDNTSDYLMEGLLKSLIHSAKIAVENPKDYEARSNIMWIATWALNTLVEKGKTTDWEVHMIGQAVGAYTDATHGMTLSAVSLPYYRYILQAGLPKFKRYAMNVWDVCPDGKTDEQIAEEGLACMEAYMKQLGLVMNLTDLGVTEDMLEGIADATLIMTGGYQVLTHEDVVAILKQAL